MPIYDQPVYKRNKKTFKKMKCLMLKNLVKKF